MLYWQKVLLTPSGNVNDSFAKYNICLFYLQHGSCKEAYEANANISLGNRGAIAVYTNLFSAVSPHLFDGLPWDLESSCIIKSDWMLFLWGK